MPITSIRGNQITDGSVQRTDLDTTTAGQAVTAKLIQGANITLNSTGADAGTGDVTVSAPATVSSDAGNIAVIGSDSKILVPQSTIWSTRLRSYNAIGNPSFEVDQRNVGNTISPTNTVFALDRWSAMKNGTMVVSTQQTTSGITPIVPGTSFYISSRSLLLTLTTQETSLAAGDYWGIAQIVEGSNNREMISDVTSISLLISTNVSPLKFAVALRDSPTTQSLVKLCTISSIGYNLIQLPNIPVMPVSGSNFSRNPGSVGYILSICFACGSTLTAPSLDVWNAGNFIGAPGMDNFAGKPATTSNINIGFVQHEPGPVCTTLQDKPFTQNYQECSRYYTKSCPYTSAPGTAAGNGEVWFYATSASFAMGWAPFPVPMAKAPTMVIYNSGTGAANGAQSFPTGTNIAITGNNASEKGLAYFGASTVVGQHYRFYYTADTGW